MTTQFHYGAIYLPRERPLPAWRRPVRCQCKGCWQEFTSVEAYRRHDCDCPRLEVFRVGVRVPFGET